MSIATGTKLGQYEVQDFIGQGAMGLVYRAYHAQLERVGAVKVMQAMAPDPDTVARFRHEAQAIAKLRHPNIVDVYDFGEFQGTPYMIVEYIPGGSLADRMAHGPVDNPDAIRYLRGIAAALDYAHGRGVVHRDVKPANVLLTNDGTPVLADFGLAKLLQGSSLKSMTGVTTGTPAYMAPEQVTGQKVGPAADRYSLATIAYEMLTGVIPFQGEALMELLYAQVHRMPPPPSANNPALGAEVDAVLVKGLAKDPAARWETATGFVEALATALAPAPARAKVLAQTMVIAPPRQPAAPTQAFAPPAAAPEAAPYDPEAFAVAYPSPPLTPVPVRHSHRRLVIGIAGALVLLVLLGVAAAVLSQATTLALSPSTTVPGGRVTVTATNLPANQVGEIQLFSVERTYFFRANSNGNVSVEIGVPSDTALGSHVVKICWNGTCHKQTPLRVVSDVALATPAASPTPLATPTASPSFAPSPSSAAAPVVSVLKPSVKAGETETVAGRNFPGSVATIYFIQGSRVEALGSASISAGQFYSTVKIPASAVAGSAAIRACYTGGCAYSPVSVT